VWNLLRSISQIIIENTQVYFYLTSHSNYNMDISKYKLRIDHCENLIHFTKGEKGSLDYEEAYKVFLEIVTSRIIKGGTGMIYNKINCVCFTESPVRCLTNKGELDSGYFSRYTPFGFQFTKKNIFEHGGRPVIYSTKDECEAKRSDDAFIWRMVSYDPTKDGRNDVSWEREWRIKASSMKFKLGGCNLVFPNQYWIDRFIEDHERLHHKQGPKSDCEECFCKREATILNYTEFIEKEKCQIYSGTCPHPEKFPWILINMNAEE